MKTIAEYCKPGIAERMLFLHPIALMIACDFADYCTDHGFPCVFSGAVSDLEEDVALKRGSATHREGRAFDVSLKGWGIVQIEAGIQYLEGKYMEHAAIGQSGDMRLVYQHDAGTGMHLHIQIAKKYAMALRTFAA